MPRITEKFIGDISGPPQGQAIFRDDDLTGFGLRATVKTKSFIVETRIEGKIKRLTIGQYGSMSLSEARFEAQKILSNVNAGRTAKVKGAPTLHQVLDAYVEHRTLRRGTIVNYRQAIRLHLNDWTYLPVTEITEDMVMTRHKELGTQLKGNTANAIMCTLRLLLNFAAENYKTVDGRPMLCSNPVSKLSRTQSWYRKQRRHNVIPDHQLAQWYRAMMAVTGTSHNVSDYLLLLTLTGLRRNEAATLKWSDVNFEARILTIKPEIAKNHREHKLPLSDFLVVLLKRRRQDNPDSEYVFPGRYGGHMVSYMRCFHQIEKLSGCRFMLHDLRRGFVSMAAKLGVQHHLAKKLLNHIGDKDDTDEYICISTEHLREPMERITQRFLELMEVNPLDWQQPDLILERSKFKLSTITLGQVLQHYLAVRKLGAESNRAYRKVIEQRLHEFMELPAAALTPEMIERKYKELCTVDGICKASKTQAGYAMKVLNSLLNFASANYKVDGKQVVLINPVKALKTTNNWQKLQSPQTVIEAEQLPAFFGAFVALRGNNVRDLLLLMLHLGLTKASAQAITWDDVDFKTKLLNVTSRGKVQSLPLTSYVQSLLEQRYLERKSEFVFPGRTGCLDRMTEVLNQVRQRSGCQFSVDDLKRTHLRIADQLHLPEIALHHLALRWQGSGKIVGNMLDVERLREPMEKISNRLLELMQIASDLQCQA